MERTRERTMRSDSAPRFLRLDARDNVAVALITLELGERLRVGEAELIIAGRIPMGHKFALEPIDQGGTIVKYGEIVGQAVVDIPAGSHVHVHNVVSARLPGTRS